MTDKYNSLLLGAAAELTHEILKDNLGSTEDTMWTDDGDGGFKYPEHIQDGFNDLYDIIEDHLKPIFEDTSDWEKESNSHEEDADDLRREVDELEDKLSDLELIVNENENIVILDIKANSLHDQYKIEELKRIYNKYNLQELEKL